jgi:hypothetical protein
MEMPSVENWNAVKHLLRYIPGLAHWAATTLDRSQMPNLLVSVMQNGLVTLMIERARVE